MATQHEPADDASPNASATGSWPHGSRLPSHRRWRSDWRTGHSCFYWYLTFDPAELADAVDSSLLSRVTHAPWMSAVPTRWMHVTMCDVGLTHAISHAALNRVAVAGRQAAADLVPRVVTLGRAGLLGSSVALAVEPLAELRALQLALRQAIDHETLAGHRAYHRHAYWPHLSLGYTSRIVDAVAGADLCAQQPAEVNVRSARLELVEVLRHHGHYTWTVVPTHPPTANPRSEHVT